MIFSIYIFFIIANVLLATLKVRSQQIIYTVCKPVLYIHAADEKVSFYEVTVYSVDFHKPCRSVRQSRFFSVCCVPSSD